MKEIFKEAENAAIGGAPQATLVRRHISCFLTLIIVVKLLRMQKEYNLSLLGFQFVVCKTERVVPLLGF
jgi:hypothetical protein